MTPHRDRLLAGEYEAAGAAKPAADDLDGMTKDQLLQVAKDRGLPATAADTKADIRLMIDGGTG